MTQRESSSKRQPIYALHLIKLSGEREQILEAEMSPHRVRNVAKPISKGGKRKVEISRDGKVLPGGAAALDDVCMELWFKRKEEEESTDEQGSE